MTDKSEFLHPHDARRKRNRARREEKLRKLFGPQSDHLGRSQDERQAAHAERVAEEQLKKRERDDALWTTQPQSESTVPSRVRKSR